MLFTPPTRTYVIWSTIWSGSCWGERGKEDSCSGALNFMGGNEKQLVNKSISENSDNEWGRSVHKLLPRVPKGLTRPRMLVFYKNYLFIIKSYHKVITFTSFSCLFQYQPLSINSGIKPKVRHSVCRASERVNSESCLPLVSILIRNTLCMFNTWDTRCDVFFVFFVFNSDVRHRSCSTQHRIIV